MTTSDEGGRRKVVEQGHPVELVEDDHRTLRDQLETIAAATTRTSLLSGLNALPKMLHEHFALEEQVGGLYDDLRSRCPSKAPKLDELCSEHHVILDELEDLCLKLKGQMGAEGSAEESTEPLMPMMRDLTRWLDRLQTHEHDESCIIGDVYYSDEGGLG